MYATVRRYTIDPGTAREVGRLADAGFLAVARTIPGFVNYTIMEGGTENGRDVLVTISIFESREGVDESVRRAAVWVKDNVMQFHPSAPSVTTGEILATTAVKAQQYSR